MRDLAAELQKVRTRWLPYVLLLAMIGGAAVQVLLFGWVAYHDERGEAEFGSFPPGLRTFALPWSLHALLDSGQFWGGVFIAFLVASAVATEYGWGTVRIAITRGQSRNRYLGTKLLGTALVSAVLLLAAFAAGVLFSLLATTLQGEPVTLDVEGGPSPAEIPLMVLRAGLGVLPYGMLAFTLAVIGRSTTLGATGTLVYKIAEMIVLPLFKALGGVWSDLRVLFIGHHADALIAANRIDALDYNSIAFRNTPVASGLPDPWLAAAAIAVYTLALAAVAFAVFERRDLNVKNE